MQRRWGIYVLLIAALVHCAGLVCADDPSVLPKYGSSPKTKAQKAADNKFISAIDGEYHGDRKKASADMAARGWQYVARGNFGDAMRRFNQAWLLNSENGTAIWGMAVIQASAGKFDDARKLFAEADKSVGGEINFSIDYAKALAMAGVSMKDEALQKEAFNRFESIYKKAPENARNLQNWAVTLFSLERYSDAWVKVKLAEATPNKSDLDPRFLEALQSRMPRPK